MAREIKLITPEHIEDYLTIYLNSYPAYKNTGEEGRNKYRPLILHSMAKDKHIHFYGLFEDGQLIAQMKLIDFDMNAFGKMVKATGLMALGVHPMYKKRGAARDMVRFFEKYTEESGAIVSMLLPFRMDFYRNMGYGYGSKMEEYIIPAISLPAADKEDMKNVTFINSDEKATAMILECYSKFAADYHGMCQKFENEIDDYYGDTDTHRVGYFEGKELMGYVTYDINCMSDTNYTLNRLEVKELVYLNQKALKVLLGFLRNQSDLCQTVVIRTGEPDFYHILPSAQNVSGNYTDFGFLETNTSSVGTMYKITDPAKFVMETPHRKFIPFDLTVRFEYYNELEHCNDAFGVKFTTEGKWELYGDVTKEELFDVTVKCNLADLSSLLMGSADFAALHRLGAVTLSKEGYADILDLLLHVSQKPWTNTDY